MKAKLLITVVLIISIGMGVSFPGCKDKGKVDITITVAPILVAEELAGKVARNFLNIRAHLPQGGMPEWKGAQLSPPVIYYCPGGLPRAYCFSVIKDGKDLGYILISADKTHFPVQEFSRSPAPHIRSLESSKRIAEVHLKEGQRLGEPIIIYTSMGMYFMVFPVLEEEQEVDRIVICSRGLFPLPQEMLKLRADLSTKEMAKEAKKSWERLKRKDFPLPGLCGYPFKYLENIPVYPYLISCHPVITAAWLDYWGMREEDESKEELIAAVARRIKEERDGMTIFNIPGRIEQVARMRGYRLEIVIKSRDSFHPEEVITFKEYKQEIDRGHPPILLFPFGPGAGKDLATALAQLAQFPSIGIGYSSDPTGDYLIVRESLFAAEKKENIVQGESPWARTGTTFYNWRGASGNLIVISISEPEKE